MRKFFRKCVKTSVKSALKWGAWANKDRSNAQVVFENIRKRLKTFENIRRYSKTDVKRLKIFENIRIFCRPLRK